MLVVLKELPHGVTAWFAEGFQARCGEQKGHAGFGEFEMIRAIKHAAGGEKIGFDDAPLRRSDLIDHLVKRGITGGEVNNVLRATERRSEERRVGKECGSQGATRRERQKGKTVAAG